MIRHLMWDVDGTLFDTYPAIALAFQRALADLGVVAPITEIDPLAKVSMDHCAQELSARYGLDVESILDGFLRHHAALPLEDQPPYAGVAAACASIQARGGSNTIVTHRRRETLLALLDAFHMRPLFLDWICGDDGFPRKPDPAAFLTLIERHAIDPAQALAIGDREIDLQAGAAAGLRTCLFGDNPCSLTPDYAIHDYAQLVAILSRENHRT